MANMKKVNQSIKKAFPNLDIEAVRGDGYVYFNGKDGFDKVDAIYTNPTTTSTDDLIRICLEDIQNFVNSQG